MQFNKMLHQNSWGIKLTPRFNLIEISFLDPVITQKYGKFVTSTHFKT